jgi:hypothetical protein
MYGGVAQTYLLWKRDGEPFKEKNAWYVNVIHPATKAIKKVRFYTDKKHADLAPNKTQYPPMHALFGFQSKEDTIVAIRLRDITNEEAENHFASKWRFGMFFNGIWYAPKDTELPPIKKADKFFYPTWKEFVMAGRKHSKELGLVVEAESPWFKEVIE